MPGGSYENDLAHRPQTPPHITLDPVEQLLAIV